MRGFKYIGLNGELVPISRNQSTSTKRYVNTENFKSEVYSFGHPDYQLLELYRRANLVAMIIKSDNQYSEEQLLACESNLNRLRLKILIQGLEVPSIYTGPTPSLKGAWMDDWIDWVCGDLNGPAQPPGWC